MVPPQSRESKAPSFWRGPVSITTHIEADGEGMEVGMEDMEDMEDMDEEGVEGVEGVAMIRWCRASYAKIKCLSYRLDQAAAAPDG
jgi:hypothetical protein